MLIHLKGCYNISGKIPSSTKEHRIQFKVPLEDKTSIIVDIISDESIVESFRDYEVSKEMWDILQMDIKDGYTLTPKLQDELSLMETNISEATKKVLYLIKYCLNCPDLNDNLFSHKGIYWSIDESKWKELPKRTYGIIDIHLLLPLNEITSKSIQSYIENDFEPFFALKHLHRAKKEQNPRHKWIDATILKAIINSIGNARENSIVISIK